MAWRFHLMDLPSREWVDRDLQLVDATVTRAVNAPAAISGSLPLGVLAPGAIREWGSLLIAEQEGHEPVAAIVDMLQVSDNKLRVEAGGWSMYPNETPWLGNDFAFIQVDPLDIVRTIWEHVQSYQDGNLGVTVDPTKSPVRVGTKEEEANFTTGAGEDVSFTSGPFRLAWWETEDLGQTLFDLANDTPFQYAERNTWTADKQDLDHRLQLGYPSIGTRRHQLHFEVGINVTVPPPMDEGGYASEVILFGAGEGRKKVNSGPITAKTGRLRRVHVATDKAISSKGAAVKAARPILDRLTGAYGIDSVEVVEHDAAPFGTFGPGDEIRVRGDAGWAELDMWVRINELTINCTTGAMSLRVETV